MKEIQLTKGYVTQVENEDYEYLNQWKWHSDIGKYTIYAKRTIIINGKPKGLRMHNLISGSKMTDHIDHNGLNNQRYNLRKCNYSQNGINRKPFVNKTSKYKGVYWLKKNNKWRSRIRINNKLIDLGLFVHEIDAAKSYDSRAKELFGEYAYKNIY